MFLDSLIMNKVYVLIGATGGLGKLIASELKKRGHGVVGVGRRKDVLEDMRNKGILDDYIQADITKDEDIYKLVDYIEKISENREVAIIYNQGILYDKSKLEEYDKKEVDQAFDINIKSIIKIDMELIKRNLKVKRIYVVSISAFYRGEWDILYQTTKGALKAYIEAISANYKELEIISIFPDTIKSGDEGMGSKLKDFPKIPGEIFAEVFTDISEGKYKRYIGYIMVIEDNSVNLYGLNPDAETGELNYKNKVFIKKIGQPVY